MSISKFEKRALNEINRIDEGLSLKLIKWFLRPMVRKALKTLENDPEFIASTDSMNKIAKELKSDLKTYKKKHGSIDPRLEAMINRM
ncbi:hypothetical protein OAA41_00555 [bacterium]|nr:hypothetical protein [bacterium]